MDTNVWFFIEKGKEPESLGGFYSNLEVGEGVEYEEVKFEDQINQLMKEHFEEKRDLFQLTYGDRSIYRIIAVDLISLEASQYRGVHLIITTQYFQ